MKTKHIKKAEQNKIVQADKKNLTLAHELKKAIAEIDGIDTDCIDISVNDDVIILDGLVNTAGQRKEIEGIITETIKKEIKIDNNLRVK